MSRLPNALKMASVWATTNRRDNIIQINLNEHLVRLCKIHAEKCTLGGNSQVHRSRNKRTAMLGEDQLVGQVTTCAASEWLNKDNGRAYDKERKIRNKNPYEGDGGIDLYPYSIDVKGSKIRRKNKPLPTYTLPVRPKELHEDCIYILALADLDDMCVYLVGWASYEMFSKHPDSAGIFKGAHTLKATSLNIMPKTSISKIRKLKIMGL